MFCTVYKDIQLLNRLNWTLKVWVCRWAFGLRAKTPLRAPLSYIRVSGSHSRSRSGSHWVWSLKRAREWTSWWELSFWLSNNFKNEVIFSRSILLHANHFWNTRSKKKKNSVIILTLLTHCIPHLSWKILLLSLQIPMRQALTALLSSEETASAATLTALISSPAWLLLLPLLYSLPFHYYQSYYLFL